VDFLVVRQYNGWMKINLLVIADDLTGTLDVAVRFAQNGLPTQVIPSQKEIGQLDPEAAVLAVNSESRHMSPADAARTVGWLADWARVRNIPHVYKKTDSVLRGNIGPELKAVMDIYNRPLMFMPAFPEAGRTTVGGSHYVDGLPLELSESARDPLNPVKTGRVADIVRNGADVLVESVPLTGVWPPLDQPNTVYIFDSAAEADLASIAEKLRDAKLLGLCAGCAGFAKYLAAMLPYSGNSLAMPPISARILIVCGSVHQKTTQQLQNAEALGFTRVVLSSEDLAAGQDWQAPAAQNLIGRLAAGLREHGRLLVHPPAFRHGEPEDSPAVITASNPASSPASDPAANPASDPAANTASNQNQIARLSEQTAANMGSLAAAILNESGPCTLFVIGGDTLHGVLNAVAATDIRPVYEIETGVALTRIDSRYGRLCLISKGGGLGPEGVLESIDQYVRRHASQ
jgi:D-threonate/D-erythronate kinase